MRYHVQVETKFGNFFSFDCDSFCITETSEKCEVLAGPPLGSLPIAKINMDGVIGFAVTINRVPQLVE